MFTSTAEQSHSIYVGVTVLSQLSQPSMTVTLSYFWVGEHMSSYHHLIQLSHSPKKTWKSNFGGKYSKSDNTTTPSSNTNPNQQQFQKI